MPYGVHMTRTADPAPRTMRARPAGAEVHTMSVPNAPRGTRHTVATLSAPAGATLADVRAIIAERIGAERATAEGIAERKPAARDGHSDGVRVRYVRADVTAAILADVLAMLGDVAESAR